MVSDPEFDDYDNEDIEREYSSPTVLGEEEDVDDLPDLVGGGGGGDIEAYDDDEEDDLEVGSLIDGLADLDEVEDLGGGMAGLGDAEGGSRITTMTWAEKRQKKLEGGLKMPQLTWEEKFEDDPLRADSPTTDLEISANVPLSKFYIITSKFANPDMLLRRQEVWVHHLQWVRRNTLVPLEDKKVHIEWEYTILTPDSITPQGQFLGIRANNSADVAHLIMSEPLLGNGAICDWKIFDCAEVKMESVTGTIKDPFIFFGKLEVRPDNLLLSEQLNYHAKVNNRVVSMGTLAAIDADEEYFFLVFNSRTFKGAERYLQQDPLIKSGAIRWEKSLLAPINVQDSDGLHHVMARSFAEARELNQIHFMDPTDILEVQVRPIKTLPNHGLENEQVIQSIKAKQAYAPKYIRHNWIERFGSLDFLEQTSAQQDAAEEAQKIRLTVSDSVPDDDGVLETEEAVDIGGGED